MDASATFIIMAASLRWVRFHLCTGRFLHHVFKYTLTAIHISLLTPALILCLSQTLGKNPAFLQWKPLGSQWT